MTMSIGGLGLALLLATGTPTPPSPPPAVTFDAAGYCAQTTQATADEAHLPIVYCLPGWPINPDTLGATMVHGYCEPATMTQLIDNGWEGSTCQPPHLVILR